MGSKQSKPSIPTTDDHSSSIKNDDESSSVVVVHNGDKKQNIIPNDSIHKNLTSSVSSGGGGGGCPMKNKDGGYNWFGRGASSSSINSSSNNKKDNETESKTNNDKNNSNNNSSGGGGCPIKHNKNNSIKEQVQYNVYSQPIDPTNNMPTVANQLPSPLQNKQLSTNRVQSTIPKGNDDSDSTWTYPSPQMFYNSLARKNKLGDTTEDDIESVVALHNNMNEKTWNKVMQWEKVLVGDDNGGDESKLLKFMGRPSDLSPKAIVKHYLFGHPLPFDRHDWTVIRKDGTEVRYVIDYYYDESRASETPESAMPALNDHEAVKSILVDVRPAVDSVEAALGRVVTMPLARRVHNNTKFEPLPILPTSELKSQVSESQQVWANIQKNVEESKKQNSKSMILKQEDLPEDQREQMKDKNSLPQISDAEAKEIALSFAAMIGQCRKAHKNVDACTNEDECAKASLALTMCLAKVVCPLQQSAVEKALNDDNVDMNDEKAVAIYNATFDAALENMAICVQEKSQKAAIARQSHPHLFKENA